MEYLACSIKDRLQAGSISEMYICVILREVLHILDHLHGERKLHRNLKASNILLSDKGEIKLVDLILNGSIGDICSLKNLSHAPFWCAPEILQDKDNTRLDKQDIWSLGITAYEIATGNHPYINYDPMKATSIIISRESPPKLEGDFSRAFKDFVQLCLTKDVKKRPSARELLTHPFVRKTKKPHILMDLFGKMDNKRDRSNSRPSSKEKRKSSRRTSVALPSTATLTPPSSRDKEPHPPLISSSSPSLLDYVIYPVLSQRASKTEDTAVLAAIEELKNGFLHLEQASGDGSCEQLINELVDDMLWENYRQQDRSSVANYLLLRWKNNTNI